jgi:hypothetical protein
VFGFDNKEKLVVKIQKPVNIGRIYLAVLHPGKIVDLSDVVLVVYQCRHRT